MSIIRPVPIGTGTEVHELVSAQTQPVARRLNTRQIVVAGMLGALTMVLEVTPIGRIPMPTGVKATTLHIPAALAGCMEGPVVGVCVGLIFGLISFLRQSHPAFGNPLISVLPRLFIGLAAWAVYRKTESGYLAGAAAAATNTVGVLSMFAVFGVLPLKTIAVVAVGNGAPELVISGVITGLLMQALEPLRSRLQTQRR